MAQLRRTSPVLTRGAMWAESRLNSTRCVRNSMRYCHHTLSAQQQLYLPNSPLPAMLAMAGHDSSECADFNPPHLAVSVPDDLFNMFALWWCNMDATVRTKWKELSRKERQRECLPSVLWRQEIDPFLPLKPQLECYRNYSSKHAESNCLHCVPRYQSWRGTKL